MVGYERSLFRALAWQGWAATAIVRHNRYSKASASLKVCTVQIVEEEVECEGSEGNLDAGNSSGHIAAVSDQTDSATVPVPPDGEDSAADGLQAGSAAADGELKPKKRVKLVSRTIDPPPPPKQVEIGRRAQVRHQHTSIIEKIIISLPVSYLMAVLGQHSDVSIPLAMRAIWDIPSFLWPLSHTPDLSLNACAGSATRRRAGV